MDRDSCSGEGESLASPFRLDHAASPVSLWPLPCFLQGTYSQVYNLTALPDNTTGVLITLVVEAGEADLYCNPYLGDYPDMYHAEYSTGECLWGHAAHARSCRAFPTLPQAAC